jgi:hypothetical protein
LKRALAARHFDVSWGWFTDRTRAGASLEGSRRLFLVLTVLSLPLAVVPLIDSFALAMALLFFAMFIAAGFIIGAWRTPTATTR